MNRLVITNEKKFKAHQRNRLIWHKNNRELIDKRKLYDSTEKSINTVIAGKHRQLNFPHFKFLNQKAKIDWLARQYHTLKSLESCIETLSRRVYLKAA